MHIGEPGGDNVALLRHTDDGDRPPSDELGSAAHWRHDYRVRVALVAAAVMVAGLYVTALRNTGDVQVITEEMEEVDLRPPRPRGDGSAPSPFAAVAATDGEEPVCEGLSPGPSWSCHSGRWQLGPPPEQAAIGGGRIDRAAGCLTEQPGPLFVCQNGLWMIESGGTSPSSPAPATAGATARNVCPQPAPGSDWTCEDGAWQPPEPSALIIPVPPVPDGSTPIPPLPPVPPVPEPVPAAPPIPPAPPE